MNTIHYLKNYRLSKRIWRRMTDLLSTRPSGLPQPRRYPGINWIGVRTLYLREVRRFWKVGAQTVAAPVVTTLLYMLVFVVALQNARPPLHGTPFALFVAPGLIMMAMLQNSFANSSFSLLVGKIQGTIVDYLMPPLSTGELLAALCAGAVTRAFCVGATVWLAMALWPGVSVAPHHVWAILWFGFLGSLFLALLGVMTSIWAEKFDHAAAVTNFVVAPLALLSGTFYSVDKLAPTFQAISHANPFFYIISGFRYGFLGVADSPIVLGSAVILGLNMLLGLACYALLRSGWKTRS